MKQLMIKPTIYKYDTCKKFAEEFHIEKGDLVITNEYIYEPFFGKLNLECDVIYQEKYGAGEPSDDMAEAIYKDIKGEHKRIIAIGGGTVIDILVRDAKLEDAERILDIYAYYVENTAITFEYVVTTLMDFQKRMEMTMKRYPYLDIEKD